MRLRIGLVGCGTIGTQLARTLQRDYADRIRITALHDVDPAHARTLQRRLHPRPPIVSLSRLVRASQLVIEAASVEAVGPLLRRALPAHRSVFLMSVGGLLRDSSWKRLLARSRGKIYVPSGALAGLDGVKALAVGRLRRLSLTTRKPPRALASAPWLKRKRIRLDRLTGARLLFEGTPQAVVSAFPQNTNVAAALALAGGAAARTRIRVIADPSLRVNVHELEAEGDCGTIRCRIESRPSTNPKTSELAIRSAIATLRRLFDPLIIGT